MDRHHRIAIDVETQYLGRESRPDDQRYVFAYTITLHNTGDRAAQLLRRHWVITDANGRVQEVEGEGVVGEQPYLRPGERYQYTSGVVLETPVGAMEGEYRMRGADEAEFDAPIPPFTLSLPHALH